MTPDERRRAGRAIADRIRQLGTTSARVAEQAQVDQSTLSALIHARRWPHRHTQDRICAALRWPPGEIMRRGLDLDGLASFGTLELLDEIRRRLELLVSETSLDAVRQVVGNLAVTGQ